MTLFDLNIGEIQKEATLKSASVSFVSPKTNALNIASKIVKESFNIHDTLIMGHITHKLWVLQVKVGLK